jgi:serralysin
VERLRVGLVGGRGNDSLNGGGGKDKLYAGKGRTHWSPTTGRDLVDGGGGVDSFQYDHGLDVVRNKP